MAKNELLWWVNYLKLCNNRLITQPQEQVFIQTDAFKKAGGLYIERSEQGSAFQEGTGSTYQSARTFSHKVCHLDRCQNVENVSYTYPGRQHDSFELFAEIGRDKESRTNADLKGNLRTSTWAEDHNYCRTFTRESQLQGSLGISAPKRFLGMEIVLSNFQQNMPNIGEETRNRPVCFKVAKSASTLLLLEARSQQSWHRCSSTEMVSQESVCIPSICLDSQSTEKYRGGESTSLIIVTPTWKTQSGTHNSYVFQREIQSFCH